jgi:signal transduction histidine kinase
MWLQPMAKRASTDTTVVGNDLPLRRLLEAGSALFSDLDMPSILQRVLEAARDLTGARHAALGVLGEDRSQLAQFVYSGIDQATHDAIGELPRGRGVLGVLIDDPRPLRLRSVGEHPRSYGFPEGHPAMGSFLGVPIMLGGEPWGNLYLTDKTGAVEFTEDDEQVTVILADWAAAAIANARLYEASEQRREELERAVSGLVATRDIAVAIGGVTGLERVLELIAKRGRALVNARAVLIMLREGADLVTVASAGYADEVIGQHIPVVQSTSGQVLERRVAERIADVSARLRIAPSELGVSSARTALIVPMLHRGAGIGVLAAFDRGEQADPFTESDEQLLSTFASQAANGVAIARSVEADRLRAAMTAADAERGRWARELHDETLQIFGGLRVLLSGTLRRGDVSRYEAAMREAIEAIERGIHGLRAIITDLRPAALDELGLRPAIEVLLERRRHDGLEITAALELPESKADANTLNPELETTVYRLVQEALTNVVKHSGASRADVEVLASQDAVEIAVRDNGTGFDTAEGTEGFGLVGMRERVQLAGGTLTISSDPEGTELRASIPTSYAAPEARMRGLM